jgi:DNA-3-methyladenine glycosylase
MLSRMPHAAAKKHGAILPLEVGISPVNLADEMKVASDYFVPERDWLNRPVLELAPLLLGALLTHTTPDGAVTVRIVEVEAYDGERDPGSHAYRGLTQRNKTMFGPGGHLYVYRHMGLHVCANIVSGPEGWGCGTLLRAGEVVDGIELARHRRNAAGVSRSDVDLAQGPARLTVALGIKPDDDGTDILSPSGSFKLQVPSAPERQSRVSKPAHQSTQIVCGPRVGVSGEGGRADLYPWRFWLKDDPHVSNYKPAPSPRRKV